MKKTALSLSTLMLAVLLFAAPAFADTLNLTLTNPIQTGTPNGTLTFDASASAPFGNSGTLFLNSDSFNLSLAGATIDDAGFFVNFPPTLAPGEGVAATLFTVSLPAAFASGTYNGFFEILGGSDPSAQDILATVNFQITTPAAVPEPGTWLLLATGLAGLAMLYGRAAKQPRLLSPPSNKRITAERPGVMRLLRNPDCLYSKKNALIGERSSV